jgi:enoyl-CoA hydratase
MVSKVFPAADLDQMTLDFARRIAKVPTMAALMIKESVNQTQDNQGFFNSLNSCFTLHELNHSHWAEINDDHYPIAKEDSGVPNWKDAPPIVPSRKDEVRSRST